jgi:RNA-directed DNA polymerase
MSKQVTEALTDKSVKRQTSNLRQRWEWAEASIWTDAMLTALETGVKGGKWFSLIDKVQKKETLEKAWKKVRANKGAPGVNKITIEKFQEGKEIYLKELQEELKEGKYKPEAVRRVYIPKGQEKLRPLGIPTIKDRVAQQAVRMAIEPIFEKEFLDMSYGFRPNKGAQKALERVNQLIKEGYTWVVDADLQSYFDTIPHEMLMNKVKHKISDGRIIELLTMWLNQEIMEECKNWKPTEGTPQGGVISPLLANIYLHDLDVEMTKAGYNMIRYADDFVVLGKSKEDAEKALETIRAWVKANGLTLHPEKTHIGNCMVIDEGFEFLGYKFEGGTTWIRNKSIQKLRDRIRIETRRTVSGSMEEVIKRLNPVLKGWCVYFRDVTKYTLGTFDSFVRRRLRALIQRRRKKKSFGAGWINQEIPNSYFANKGLFNMEAYQVRYRACQSR